MDDQAQVIGAALTAVNENVGAIRAELGSAVVEVEAGKVTAGEKQTTGDAASGGVVLVQVQEGRRFRLDDLRLWSSVASESTPKRVQIRDKGGFVLATFTATTPHGTHNRLAAPLLLPLGAKLVLLGESGDTGSTAYVAWCGVHL